MARTLTARYAGYCRRCASRYPAGTEITDAHGGWSHVHCPPTTRPAAGRISAPRSAASAASAAVRTNGKAANCDRCGTRIPAGAGRLYRCIGSSSGCFKHFDEDGGWHVVCLDEDACNARRAEARKEAEERHARTKAREAAARRLRDLIVRPETFDAMATADGEHKTHYLNAITTVFVGDARTVWYESCAGDSYSWAVPTTDEIRQLAAAAEVPYGSWAY